MTSPRRAGLAAALALAFLALAATPALAEHVYSHRYDVYGRVVGADGVPVENVTVDLYGITNALPVSGLCAPQPERTETDAWGPRDTQVRTNAFGEYAWCLHVHAIPRGNTDAFHVGVGDARVEAHVNALMRQTVVNVVLDVDGNGTAAAADSYTVSGRVLDVRGGEQDVDGVDVYGDVLAHENVTVTYESADGENVTVTTRTNAFGTYAVRVNATGDADGAGVVVSAAGIEMKSFADPLVRASNVDVLIRNPPERGEKTLEDDEAPFMPGVQEREDASARTPAPGLALVLAGAGAAAAAVTRRRRG